MSLVCKILRNFSSGKQISDVRGHGLLIHRQASIVHIEVILSELILHVKARVLADGIQEQNMCLCFQYILSQM